MRLRVLIPFAFVLTGCELLPSNLPLCEAPVAKLLSVEGVERLRTHDVDGSTWFTVPRGSTFTVTVESEQLEGCIARLAVAADKNAKAEAFLDGPGVVVDAGAEFEVDTSKAKGKQLTVTAKIAADAPVGAYGVRVKLGDKVLEPKERLVVLFNAASIETAESVASLGEGAVAEYVEGQAGVVWDAGNRARGWNYEQFTLRTLRAALDALGDLPLDDRRDPLKATMRLVENVPGVEAMFRPVSAQFPAGDPSTSAFLEGVSSKAYGCRAGGGSVKYGQCWVFAAVTTSLARAIGIPSRVSTNLDAAHDDAAGGCTSSYPRAWWDLGGPIRGSKACEPASNFHVSTDVFVRQARGSAPSWNAVDATPQEPSDGKYQTGPATTFSHDELAVALADEVAPSDPTSRLARVVAAIREPVVHELEQDPANLTLAVERRSAVTLQPGGSCGAGKPEPKILPVTPAKCDSRTGCAEAGLGSAGITAEIVADFLSGKPRVTFRRQAAGDLPRVDVVYKVTIESPGLDPLVLAQGRTGYDFAQEIGADLDTGGFDPGFIRGETDTVVVRGLVYDEAEAIVGFVHASAAPLRPALSVSTAKGEDGSMVLLVTAKAKGPGADKMFLAGKVESSAARVFIGGKWLEAPWTPGNEGFTAKVDISSVPDASSYLATWKCQDECLEQSNDDVVCGETDHL